MDSDYDNDGISHNEEDDGEENKNHISSDNDSDGAPDTHDEDDDNDGVPDFFEFEYVGSHKGSGKMINDTELFDKRRAALCPRVKKTLYCGKITYFFKLALPGIP